MHVFTLNQVPDHQLPNTLAFKTYHVDLECKWHHKSLPSVCLFALSRHTETPTEWQH